MSLMGNNCTLKGQCLVISFCHHLVDAVDCIDNNLFTVDL